MTPWFTDRICSLLARGDRLSRLQEAIDGVTDRHRRWGPEPCFQDDFVDALMFPEIGEHG